MPCSSKAQCDAWKNDNVASFPVCPYCQAGNDWAGLCSKGQNQSPVAISWEEVEVETKSMMFFQPEYQPTTVSLLHTGSALMMNGDFGSVLVEGTHFDAQSITIHAPPEHTVESVKSAAVELQILHKRRFIEPPNAPELLMVSVMFDEDEVTNSMEMAKLFFQQLPDGPVTNGPNGNKTVQIPDFNLNEIITNDKPIMWYNGSLTAPPCTEGITWAVMMGQNSKLSTAQVAKINALFKTNPKFAKGRGNNRIQQPLNGRKFLLRSNCGTTGAIACPRSSLPPGVTSDDASAVVNSDDAVLFAD